MKVEISAFCRTRINTLCGKGSCDGVPARVRPGPVEVLGDDAVGDLRGERGVGDGRLYGPILGFGKGGLEGSSVPHSRGGAVSLGGEGLETSTMGASKIGEASSELAGHRRLGTRASLWRVARALAASSPMMSGRVAIVEGTGGGEPRLPIRETAG